jgi:hypothetical protein
VASSQVTLATTAARTAAAAAFAVTVVAVTDGRGFAEEPPYPPTQGGSPAFEDGAMLHDATSFSEKGGESHIDTQCTVCCRHLDTQKKCFFRNNNKKNSSCCLSLVYV